MESSVECLRGIRFFSVGNPLHIGRVTHLPGGRFRPHTHDFHEFFLVEEGVLQHLINGTEERLPPGTLRWIFPTDCHHFRNTGKVPVRHLNVALPATLLGSLLSFLQIDMNALRQGPQALLVETTESYIEALVRQIETASEELRPVFIRALLTTALSSLVKDHSYDRAPPWLQEACRAMTATENRRIGLPRFVELSGVSQEHLTRVIKKTRGITPTAFVNGLRLDHAAELLETTRLDLREVADEAGFHNLSHFILQFKKRFGKTPGAWKRRSTGIMAGK